MSNHENEEETPSSKFFYVYILACNDGQLYTGCTSNLKERFNRHHKGWVAVTKNRRPVQLKWCCAFLERTAAFEFEQYLKTGSGRAFANKHLLQNAAEI
jgi:predicted GIY-YIG superfamily endonuclease